MRAPGDRMIRDSMAILALGWMAALLQYVAAIALTRAVGPAGKGSLALLMGVMSVLIVLLGAGIPSGAAVALRGSQRRGDVIATALALTTGGLGLLLPLYALAGHRVLLIVLSADDLGTLAPQWTALALVSVIPLTFLALADVVFIAVGDRRIYALRSIGTALTTAGLTWLLALEWGYGVGGALLAVLVGALAGMMLTVVWWRRNEELREGRVTVACARLLLKVGLQQQGVNVIALVAKRLDVFVIARLLTLQDAGFYAAAMMIPQSLLSIPRATMWPMVSALSAGAHGVPEAVARASRLQLAMMVLLAVGLWPLVPTLVVGVFGSDFAPAVAPFRWALVGLAFTPVTITVNAILTARHEPGLAIVAAVIGTVTQVVVMVLLTPTWGISAPAFALSINFATTAGVQLAIAAWRGIPAATLIVPTREDFDALRRAVRGRVPV